MKLRKDKNVGIGTEKYMNHDQWDRLMNIDENLAGEEIQQYLDDSETRQDKANRKFLKERWGIDMKYKEESKKDFQTFKSDLQRAEMSMQDMHYFHIKVGYEIKWFLSYFNSKLIDSNDNFLDFITNSQSVKDLNKFLAKQLTSEANNGSAGKITNSKASFCSRCLLPFYSKVKLSEHIEQGCNQRYFREILPKNSKKHGKFREFRKYCAQQRSRVIIFGDFECALKNGVNSCQFCTRSGYLRCRCTSLDQDVDQSLKPGETLHVPTIVTFIAVR